jgi:hypothetical protein
LSRRTRIAAVIVLAAAATLTVSAQTIRVSGEGPVSIGLPGKSLIEPHLAIHPTNANHLLGAVIVRDTNANMADAENRKQVRCASFVSLDGGAKWERHDFPITDCGDPWVAVLPDGHAIFAAAGGDAQLPQQGEGGLVVYHSPDGGRTWDEHPTGLGRSADHPTVAVDAGSAQRAGWLYVVSGQIFRGDQGVLRSAVVIARSRNGGKTFDPPVSIHPNNLYVLAETPAVLSDGTLIASYVEAAEPDGRTQLLRRRAWVVSSVDGGYDFARPLFVNEACGSPTVAFAQSVLAVDRSSGPFRDRLYFACNQPATHQILVSYSADRGMSWSTVRPAHTAAPGDTLISRKVMAMAVNMQGTLGVVWNESRTDAGGPCFDAYFSASRDGGATFGPQQRISNRTSCPRPPVSGSGGSDYYGMVTDDRGRFRVLWSGAAGNVLQLQTLVIDVNGQSVKPQ